MYNILRWACCQKFHSYLLYNNLARVNEKIKDFGPNYGQVMDRYWSTQPCIHPGVWVYDALARSGKHMFLMRGVCLYTVTDFPGLGLISGCATKGYIACPYCGPNTKGRYSHELRKTTYECQHRKWLGRVHPFREAVDAFDGFPEYGHTPPSVTAAQILEWAKERENWLNDCRRVQAEDPVRRTGIKQRSMLYDLPYWEVINFGQIHVVM